MNFRQAILLILRGAKGNPMTDPALRFGMRSYFPDATESELSDAIPSTEAAGLTSSVRDEAIDRLTWTLTDKGNHAARKL